MNDKVLIIEDDGDLAQLISYNLSREGYRAVIARDGAAGLKLLRSERPDLVVLDIMLPDIDGLELCRAIRREPATSALPIIFLTARAEEIDRVIGLELGADDYVTKPFSPRELLARVKAVLRRSRAAHLASSVIVCGPLHIDLDKREVTRDGRKLDLSALEFNLLYFLASNRERVFSRDELLDRVWGRERFVTPRSVDVYIRRLREKIEPDAESPRFIITVRGFGYKFVC